MAPGRLEVADVFREHGAEFLEAWGKRISSEQRRVLRDITQCRTALLGGHKLQCDHCGHEEISYNSCRNRHCPKCQASARAQWLDRESERLLDAEYFHVVFTLPEALGPIALQNKREIYGTLFQAAAETLSTIARDPKHLGAETGFLMVLHTWGQSLHHHPHVHVVVPGGGISLDRTRWISSRRDFFVSVRVLSRLFRGKFLASLERLRKKGSLVLAGDVALLADPAKWEAFVKSLKEMDWVVYAKRPFGSASVVLKYLARYTHRVAISSGRLVSLKDGKVSFRWKDYAQGSQQKTMTLEAVEFIRRFLLHVLPRGFVRIRHYGFLSNRLRQKKLALARSLIEAQKPKTALEGGGEPSIDGKDQDGTSEHERRCASCKKGRMIYLEDLAPLKKPGLRWEGNDTS